MRKVLVADGVQGGRELLRILLEHEGYEVFEASTGAAALEMARAALPDLILLDVENEPAGAYASVREMRLDEHLKDRAILAVTDRIRRADQERLADAGFSGFLPKPVILRVLREQLRQLAALHRGPLAG
jgi:CheY-like chemotaxis protein